MRLAAIFWTQSLVRKNDDRQILLDLDIAIQRIRDVDPAIRRSFRLPTSTTIYWGDGPTPRVGNGRNGAPTFR
jgi:predicted 2-oxoglutarate/Fe(II)-dependent dioxygenase YbiX